MTQTEHFTAIKTTEQPRERDWLAISLCITGLGLVALSVAVLASAASLYVTASKIELAVDAIVQQQALTGKAYEVAIKHYEPPFENPPPVDPAESPFGESAMQ